MRGKTTQAIVANVAAVVAARKATSPFHPHSEFSHEKTTSTIHCVDTQALSTGAYDQSRPTS